MLYQRRRQHSISVEFIFIMPLACTLVQLCAHNLTFIRLERCGCFCLRCTHRSLCRRTFFFSSFQCIFGSIPRYFGNTSKATKELRYGISLFTRRQSFFRRDSVVGELLVVPGLSVIVMLFFWMSKCSVYHRRC